MHKIGIVLEAMMKAAPLRMWALIMAGPVMTAVDVLLIFIVWQGGWMPDLAGEQLRVLGILAFAHAAIIGVIVITLAAARASAHGPGGISLDIQSGSDPAPSSSPAKVTVTATAEGAKP